MTHATMPEIRYTVPASHPYAKYYSSHRLMTWHPTGILDDANADQVVEFLESWEKVANVAFNRFVDMSGFSRIQLSLDHIVRLARRRRTAYRGRPVKTAFYAVRLISVHIARMYEELMAGSRIEVRTFRELDAAAEWLEVPLETIKRPRNS